ncbi:MAG: protein kinase [Kofleriaceae bacterium]
MLRRLGKGAMGEVYLVEHVQIGRLEALKVMRGDLARTRTVMARFRREARAIARLHHPNIVGIHDVGQLPDGRMYMTTEYADGEPLDTALAVGGAIPVSRALGVIAQLADAVAHAHLHGVIHRDLKPSNIILVERRGRRDVVKVLDFGIAKIVETGYQDSVGTKSGAVYGTPLYIAPEMIEGVQDDPRIDVYAMGCIAWELLTGKAVFAGRVLDVMHMHVTQTPAPPSSLAPSVPPELDALVLRCLAKDPADRIASAAAIVAAINAVPGFQLEPSEFGPVYRSLAAPRAPSSVREVRAAILTIAESLLGAGCDAPELVIAVADLEQLTGELRQLDAEARDIERQIDAAEASARYRESSLRFALGQLRSHHERLAESGGSATTTETKIGALEARLATMSNELARASSALGDAAIGLAAKRQAAELELANAYGSVEQAIAGALWEFAHEPTIYALVAELPADVQARLRAPAPTL